MESTRQKKIARLLERDFGEIFQRLGKDHFPGAMLSVTKVRVTPDLGIARVYISMFPVKDKNELLVWVRHNSAAIRNDLAQRVRHQLRIVPELEFYVDDSLDYQENIDRLLRGEGENPIK
ncbi:MAG: 30S ribosome-binding factor RbfA [Bacteroidetes bacterium]|uniref:Ribosome-binding factor A n=1 Tax=Phaeocystidibacter marisrubri TaxID=1577780 RepID=A0A6L3ZDC1_9FLAO|nr:30S ribosome-binding factor RbfA [Phaeocystidibacter marisrubri]KAB2815228.1 30S ribosome-binding factor RbfA [Phaeocystidibacter marisrubri]TNE27255.1 MAG: 30S ribosome-binding factor RbfA [Bacteroidota bacterium]GGH70989.1 ribosome-binding factor A [Phaeocystidibacter marisrubri]